MTTTAGGEPAATGPLGDELDVGALERRLAELTGEVYEVLDVARSATGHANVTWLLDARPRPLVVKVQLEPSVVHDRRPEHEPTVLRALAGAAAPVPRVVAASGDRDVFGAPWFAMERIDAMGVPDDRATGYMASGWFAEGTDAERGAVWESFYRALARVHSVAVDPSMGIVRGGSHRAVLEYLRAAAHDAAPGRVPKQDAIADRLIERAPADADAALAICMGDARLANAMVHDGEVVGLVDWEISFVGNPAGDVGYGINYDRWLARCAGRRLGGLPSAADTWAHWEDLTGRRVPPGDRRYWEAVGSLLITVTATRSIAQMIDAGLVDVASPEEINPFIAFTEELLDG